MKNTVISIIIVVLIGLGAWAIFFRGDSTNKEASGVVAVVNGEEITQSAYDALEAQLSQTQEFNPITSDEEKQTQLKDQIINSLLSQALLRQDIADSGITVTDADISAQIETIKGQFENETAYQEALKTQGTTEEGLRTQVGSELVTQSYFEQKLKFSSLIVTDEEIKTAYDQAITEEEVPPLEEVRDQVKQFVLQQKQQALINAHVEELKKTADIEILI